MWSLHGLIVILVYLTVWTKNLRISRKAINLSIFHLKTYRILGQSKRTLSNNNIKCGKLFIGYSTINWITNYTTTGKYCKLINCSAWWRLMFPTAPVVPFSNWLATVFFKKHNSKKSWVWCYWCVLCRRIKCESMFSLWEPQTLFKGFNQNPIKKYIDSGTMLNLEVLKC